MTTTMTTLNITDGHGLSFTDLTTVGNWRKIQRQKWVN